jgi:hypothetical protein
MISSGKLREKSNTDKLSELKWGRSGPLLQNCRTPELPTRWAADLGRQSGNGKSK